MKGQPSALYRFGDWLVEPHLNRVTCEATERHLEPKSIAVLCCLLERPGEVISIGEILDEVWPHQIVEPNALHRHIARIRHALDDDPRAASYIQTIPKQGYRAIAPVNLVSAGEHGKSISNQLAATRAVDGKHQAIPRLRATRRDGWLIAGVLVAILASSGLLFLRAPASEDDVHTLAVLPFANSSRDADNAYLADGITLELIQALADIPQLRVSSATASAYFRGKQMKLASVGDELNVQYVIEGRVRVSGKRVRTHVQLSSVEEGFAIWSQTFDRDHTETFRLPADISRAIVSELPLLLDDDHFAAAVTAGTIQPAAYDAYLRGGASYVNAQKPEDLDKAEAFYRTAIELDPLFFDAHAWLANVLRRRANYPRGQQRQEEAVALLEGIEQADVGQQRPHRADHLALLSFIRRDWAGNEAVLSAELMDNAPEASWFNQYGQLLHLSGLPRPALAYSQVAETLEPLNPFHKLAVGSIYFFIGEYNDANAKMDECLNLMPNNGECVSYKAASLARLGQVEEALELLGEGVWASTSSRCLFLLEGGEDCDPSDAYDTVLTANLSLAVLTGDFDHAFDLLDDALENDRSAVIYVRQQSYTWPAAFLADPRWQEYLRRVGLDDAWRNELCGRAQRLEPYTGINVACSDDGAAVKPERSGAIAGNQSHKTS